MASAGIQPRGHGLVGAWIRCKGVPLARCVAFDAVSGVCILEDGKKERKERLHGPGSTPFEVLSLPPPFAVAAIACGLCGDPPACKTECCGGYLCSACTNKKTPTVLRIQQNLPSYEEEEEFEPCQLVLESHLTRMAQGIMKQESISRQREEKTKKTKKNKKTKKTKKNKKTKENKKGLLQLRRDARCHGRPRRPPRGG